jgi:peptide deformylase
VALKKIRYLGDPVLRQKSRSVEQVDSTYRELVDDMIETMYASKGIGLAAPQIGIPERVIVLDKDPGGDYGKGGFVIINPVILSTEGKDEMEEGCLSIPDIRDVVTRAEKVRVKGLDLEGNEIEIEATGLMAKVVQHEVDHINGLLFIDHLGPLKRGLHVRKWRKIKKELEEAG